MKGDFHELALAFIQVAIILVFVIWAINPIYRSIELAQQNSAKLNAQEIAGIINTMKASQSSHMVYNGFLPPVKCTVEINDKFVKFDLTVGGKKQTAVLDIVQTPVHVSGGSYECSRRRIKIERQGGEITVS